MCCLGLSMLLERWGVVFWGVDFGEGGDGEVERFGGRWRGLEMEGVVGMGVEVMDGGID